MDYFFDYLLLGFVKYAAFLVKISAKLDSPFKFLRFLTRKWVNFRFKPEVSQDLTLTGLINMPGLQIQVHSLRAIYPTIFPCLFGQLQYTLIFNI